MPRILGNPKFNYRIHKCLAPVPILSQLEPVHTSTPYFLQKHFNIILRSATGSPQWSLSLRFPQQDPIHPLSSPIRAKCPAHLILLDFITPNKLGEEYRSLSSTLCNFLHFPVSSSLLDPNIFLSTLFSNTVSLLSSLNVCEHVSHPYNTTGRIVLLCTLIFKLLDSKLEDKRF